MKIRTKNKQAKIIDTTLSTFLQTNTSSDSASFQAASLKVINADMKRSRITSYKYHKGTLKKSPWENTSLSKNNIFDFGNFQASSLKIKYMMNKNAQMSVINTAL